MRITIDNRLCLVINLVKSSELNNTVGASMSAELLKAENITKKYNRQIVLNGVNLSVSGGEGIALVGENGCGKSTLLRILCGITNPTSGRVTGLRGLRLALIPDRYEKINMTVRCLMRQLIRFDRAENSVLERYYDEYSLTNTLDTPMKYLSKGSLQKIAVIQALISERDILIMDEPLSGQDAGSKAAFAKELRTRKDNGMAVVMACHEPYLIEQLADSIVQIKNGALVEGSEYMFSRRRVACSFLIEYSGSDICEIIANKEIRENLSISRAGAMLLIKADSIYANELLRIFVDSHVHIVKFEESDDK